MSMFDELYNKDLPLFKLKFRVITLRPKKKDVV